MTKDEIRTNDDFEAYIAEKEKSFSELIDQWIQDGPTYKREKLLALGKKLHEANAISEDEYALLLECATSVPQAGDGMINLSFGLDAAKKDAEFKSYIAKVMAMMSFFGQVD